jgi:mannose-6-phosphate isomerase-like protein (cupin superfamily)
MPWRDHIGQETYLARLMRLPMRATALGRAAPPIREIWCLRTRAGDLVCAHDADAEGAGATLVGRPVPTDQTLLWPDGSTYRITRSSADTGGEALEMELELPANGWAPQPHVHPRLTEEYEVLDGSLHVLIGSDWRTLIAGETATVSPGTVHTFRVGDGPVRVRNEHRPALDFEPYIKRLCAAANERDLGDLSSVRALLYIAVLVREFPLHSRAPGRAVNAAVPALAAVGRLLGLRTTTPAP